MSTVFELERLRALVERLRPLASVQRGDVIRADNWNVVVESLIELARAVTSLESEGSVPPHDHPSEVSINWLDDKLRSLLERGPLSDPVAVTRVTQVEQRASQLSGDLASVDDKIKGLRERLDEAITRDLVRENSVVRVTKKVDGIADTREDVLSLRQTMDTIRVDLTDVIDLRGRLQVNGRPVDMQSFNTRMVELERLRERLTMPNGQLLDAITVEQRLREVENKFIRRDELDDILGGRKGELSADDFGRIQASVGSRLAADLDSMIKKNDERMRAEFNTRFSDVDQIVSRAVSDSISSVQKSISETVRGDFNKLMEDRTRNLQAEFDGRIRGLRDELGLSIDRTKADLSDQFDSIRKEFPELQKGLSRAEAAAVTSVTELEKKLAAQLDAERTRSDARFTAEASASDKRAQDRIAQSQKESDVRTQSAIDKALISTTDNTRQIAAQEVAAGIKKLESTLDSRIQTGVRENIDASVEKAVDRQLGDVEKKLRATVSDEVKRVVAENGGQRTVVGGTTGGTGGLTGGTTTPVSDFTRITGIGAAFADRLQSKGIRTYADLSKMKPADLAAILGRPEAEVTGMIKEAAKLARL